MIEIYNKSNRNFDYNGDMILKPSLCDLEVELNGIIEVTLEHPYDKEGRWKYIVEDNILRVPYPWKKEGQLFYIYDKEKGMTGVTCKARHIFFDLASEILIDCRPTNATGQEALNKILEGTGFTGHSNIITRNSAYYIRKHIANEALISDDENSFINRWGGELYVDNFHVYMNERTGGEYGVTFRYGQDLIDLKENSNIDNIITRILPVGFNGITIPEHYVDSPLINKYRKVKADVIKFDHIKVKESPEDEEGYNTLEEAQEALREACKNMFDEGIDKLLYQIDVEVAKLENTLKYKEYKNLLEVGLGDTVGVEHLDIGINIKTRVIKFVYDCISEKFKNITLGNYIENYIDTQNNTDNILNRILNNDGTVNAIEVAGVLNAINVKMRAMKDIAQKQDVRALLCEDLDPESPTYGAMCYGTMGFMIASERTPDGRDWDWRTFGTGKGFFADLIVAGTMLADRIRGGVLESIDGSIQIDLSDTSSGIQFKQNGKKAIDIVGRIIKFFDWDGEGNPVGQMYSTRLNGNADVTGIVLANTQNSYVSIAYELDGQFYPYIRFDKSNVDQTTTVPITIFTGVDFRGDQIWFGKDINSIYKSKGNDLVASVLNNFIVLDRETSKHVASFRNRRCYFASNDNVYFDATPEKFAFFKDGQAYFFKEASSERIWSMYDFMVDKRLHCNGDFTVSGTKNCIQSTENYGDRLFYSVEDCENYLTDRSMEVFTVEKIEKREISTNIFKRLFKVADTKEYSYERVILLDSIFKEAVRTDSDYTVEIFKQGWGDYRIKEQTKDYFIVEADREDFTFKYVVTAKRRGFEKNRLEEFFKPENYTDLKDISNKSIEELGEVVCEHEDN